MAQPFPRKGLEREREPGRQWCLPPYRDICQCMLSELHRVGRWQDRKRAILLENHQPHSIPALVGVVEQ